MNVVIIGKLNTCSIICNMYTKHYLKYNYIKYKKLINYLLLRVLPQAKHFAPCFVGLLNGWSA